MGPPRKRGGQELTGYCSKGFCNLNLKQTDRAIFWDNVIRRIMPDKIPLSSERQVNTACGEGDVLK